MGEGVMGMERDNVVSMERDYVALWSKAWWQQYNG